MPGKKTWAALETAPVRVAQDINSQVGGEHIAELRDAEKKRDVGGAGDSSGADGAGHDPAEHGKHIVEVRDDKKDARGQDVGGAGDSGRCGVCRT